MTKKHGNYKKVRERQKGLGMIYALSLKYRTNTMPELPEVETVKNDLRDKIIGEKIISIFPLWEGIVKDMPFKAFVGQVEGAKITQVERRAKNLIIKLSGGLNLLIHLKMTGHIIIASDEDEVAEDGKWKKSDNKLLLDDRMNQYIRIIFYLSGGTMMAISDLRKFAYIKLVDNKELVKFLSQYGPEPFGSDFTAKNLTEILASKKIAIKKVLMDQKVVAGIGNIYADEILWASGVHPLTSANKLQKKDVEAIYKNTRKILKLSIDRRGTSTSDFRDTKGKAGTFGDVINVYRKTDIPCPRCGKLIRRIVVGGRGTHFCPRCQEEIK